MPSPGHMGSPRSKRPTPGASSGGRLTDKLRDKLVAAIYEHQSELDPGHPKYWDEDAIVACAAKDDSTLKRKKKDMLAKALNEAINSVKKTQTQLYPESQQDREDSDELDSDFSFDPETPLMEVKDTNFLNRSILSVYNKQKPSESPEPSSLAGSGTPASTVAGAQSTDATGEEGLGVGGALGDTASKSSLMDEEQRVKSNKRRQKGAGYGSESKKQKTTAASLQSKWPTPTARLSDLGGIDHCVEDVLQLIGMPLKHPEIYLHLGIQPPRGVLLHGPPGCGKTLLANAIAGEAGVPFISISAPSVVSGMSGESEKKIREVFEEAKDMAPCLLFIDEIDAITPKRETAQREMERRIVAQLLTCMDDLSLEKTNNKPVMIIGATNRPDSLDPALRRAGRFDREISMGVPDEKGRCSILQKLCSKLRLSGDFDFVKLAKMTPGYVGADLNALTAEAGMLAVKRIFHSLRIQKSVEDDLPEDGGSSAMEVDEDSESATFTTTRPVSVTLQQTRSTDDTEELTNGIQNLLSGVTPISAFLESRPEPLTEEELEPLCITHEDFLQAVKIVQPSSKREGFATVPGVTWADIGALSYVRDELRMAVVEPIRHPEHFSRMGITAPMGVLLYGPPGCGKTLLAKAVANESHCNFISVKGPELLNKYVGESERAVRMVFARAQASYPCVIFFDELDALCPARSNEAESQSSSRLVNTLLTEMDGMQGRKQVYVIAATNRPDMIDPAMLRPGRLDKTLYVDLPNAAERLEILRTLSRQTPLGPTVDLQAIASDPRCEGFSGADLASLIREAAVAALRSTLYTSGPGGNIGDDVKVDATVVKQMFVSPQHFATAFTKVAPSVGKKDRKRYELLRVKFGSLATSNEQANEQAAAPINV
ncbi:hypothetical protein HK104_001807 [Borealophlyctis nickersoniae]|nr:hypothetical protein HK104_001807 [Borealophlyctis nickersoniae]